MANATLNIIRFDSGDNNILVHRSEITDFNCESVLIVNESQLALLYKDGQAEGPFKSGRYNLPTNNLPKFRSMFAKLFRKHNDADPTPFTCEVYFINTVNDITVTWGTPSRILVKDPLYNELVNVGANGAVKIKISDPMRFVVSISGQQKEYTLDKVAFSIRSDIMTVLKTHIASMIVDCKVSLLEISTKLMELSTAIERKLNERLEEYGLTAVHFTVEDVSIDETSKARLLERQRKINNREDVVADSAAQTTADEDRMIRMAGAMAKSRELQGYSYQDEQYWKTQQQMASHPNFVGGYGYPYPPQPYGQPYPPQPYGQPYPQPGYGMPYPGAPAPGYPAPGYPAQGGYPPQGGYPAQGGYNTQQPPQNQGGTQGGHQMFTHSQGASKCPKCGYPITPRTTICPNCDFDLENNK